MAILRHSVMLKDLPLRSSLNYKIFVTGDLWSLRIHPIAWRMPVIRSQRLLLVKMWKPLAITELMQSREQSDLAFMSLIKFQHLDDPIDLDERMR